MAVSISQFFVLSPRGDTIISRDYRSDCPKNTTGVLSWVKLERRRASCVLDEVHCIQVKKSGLYFVMTTRFNVSPCLFIDLLNRLQVFKDYCGILSEGDAKKFRLDIRVDGRDDRLRSTSGYLHGTTETIHL